MGTPMLDLAKDIKKQRTLIEDNCRLMTNDIEHYIKEYFKKSGNDEIRLDHNPFKNNYGNSITAVMLTKDNRVLVHGLSYDVELCNIKPIEQALLFEHIVKALSKAYIYVVLEERFDPNDATTTKIVGTFRCLENAQECLGGAVKNAQSLYPEIWEQYQNEGKTNVISNKNEYNISSSEYYYNIKVVEQILEDVEW